MLGNLLSEGDKVEITSSAGFSTGSYDKKIYYSLLVEILDDNKVCLTMPIQAGKVIPLSVGERYWIIFYSHSGIYQAKGLIVDRQKQGNVSIMDVRLLTELERIQRRQFFRLECILDIEYRIMDDTECKCYEILRTKAYRTSEDYMKIKRLIVPVGNTWYKGVATDISGGGMRFNTKEKHDESLSYIELQFQISIGNTSKTIQTPARVIRYVPLKNLQDTYEFRVEFIEIATRDREDIVQYVFSEDRNRRKKILEKK